MKKLISILILSLLLLTGCGKKQEISTYDKIIERDMLIVGITTESKPFGRSEERRVGKECQH